MKVFHCSNHEYWKYGGMEEIELIVVAETREVALGLCLEEYKNCYNDKFWNIEEIQTEKNEIIFISSRAN